MYRDGCQMVAWFFHCFLSHQETISHLRHAGVHRNQAQSALLSLTLQPL